MAKLNKKTKSGFTIIEVVLVLAIAGLIFLMVFVALPALQKAQRDTARKNDLSILNAAINNYQAAYNYSLPGGDSGIYDGNMSGFLDKTNFVDPSRGAYTIKITKLTDDGVAHEVNDDNLAEIQFYKNARCSSGDGNKAKYDPAANNYAIVYQLEAGGLYCLDNS